MQTQQSDPSTWPLLYVPIGRYLGYSIALQHHQHNQYKVNITRAWDFTNIISDRTFPLEKKGEALAHAQELIDQDVAPILPY